MISRTCQSLLETWYVTGVETILGVCLIGNVHPFVCIQTVIERKCLVVETLVDGKVNIHLAVSLGALGGDKDNTVCTTVTVKGAGSGILQH